jgi:hypothetical protein
MTVIRDIDVPARIVAAAAGRLPEDRRDWGRAMVAELTQIQGQSRRWRFAVGVVRVAAFPPSRSRVRVLIVALVGVMAAVAATVVTDATVPSLSVFVAALGLLLSGYATIVTTRSPRPRLTAPYVIVGLVAVAGVSATIATVVVVGMAYPTATVDRTHVLSVLFALVLVGYLVFALARPRFPTPIVLWWAIGGALVSGTVWVVSALTTAAPTVGVITLISPVGAAATLGVSVCASASARNSGAGVRAGLLTAVLGAPILFAVDMFELLRVPQFTLTDPYDVAAFPHSGYPDVASYVLSDAIGGHIIGGLILYPIVLVAVAALGAIIGAGITHVANGRTATGIE